MIASADSFPRRHLSLSPLYPSKWHKFFFYPCPPCICVTPLDTANIHLIDPPFQEVVSATTLALPVALRGRAASRHSTASARRRAAHPPAPARRRSASFHQRPAFPSSERHNDDGIKNKPPTVAHWQTMLSEAAQRCCVMLVHSGHTL